MKKTFLVLVASVLTLAAQPAAITLVSGSPQTIQVGGNAALPFVVAITDANNAAVPGAVVAFTAPSTGPSGVFSATNTTTVTTDANGQAATTGFGANTFAGSYLVVASVSGVVAVVNFNLTNTPVPACTYTMTRTPNGPVLVYRDGLLQREHTLTEPGDYDRTLTMGSYMPTITPLTWNDNDYMSAVITRAVPLSFVYQGQTVSYWGYSLWREDWNCVGIRDVPTTGTAELKAKRMIVEKVVRPATRPAVKK